MLKIFLLMIAACVGSIWSGTLNAEEQLLKASELSGTVRITGNGPERHLVSRLAEAFEEQHPAVSIDVFWHENAKPIRTIELHETDIGVTGFQAPHLRSTIVARDGIAILTNFSNPVADLSLEHVSGILSGKIRYWSQVHEEAPEMKIRLINRTENQNIRQGLINLLKIKRIPRTARMVDQERHAINAVTGDLSAVTFVSITPALRAKEDGVAINLLFIEKIEPEYQTVLDKTYPLQRPVVFNTDSNPTPLTIAFEQFVLSPSGQRIVRTSQYYPLATE